MIAIVCKEFQEAWDYLSAGIPEPIFTVVRSPMDAVDVQPDAVVYISGDVRVYEQLVARMELLAAQPVGGVALHIVSAQPAPLLALSTDDYAQAPDAGADEQAQGDQVDEHPARVVVQEDPGQE
jgi:hypothetical protein